MKNNKFIVAVKISVKTTLYKAFPKKSYNLVKSIYNPPSLYVCRFNKRDIKNSIKLAKRKFPDRKVYVMTDTNISIPQDSQVTVLRNKSLNNLKNGSIVLAYESDEKALDIVRDINNNRENINYFGALSNYPPARYFNRNDIAKEVLIEDAEMGLDKYDTADFENIIQAIEITRHLSGDYVEIGVYKGTSAHIALSYMHKTNLRRRAFLLDTFEGFSYSAARESADAAWADTHNDVLMDSVVQLFRGLNVDVNIQKLNIIEDELPQELSKISCVNIDVDMYEPVKAALFKVAPLLEIGGIIICEDQGHTPYLIGAYVAVMDFLRENRDHSFLPIHMLSGQMFLIKISNN